MISPITNYLNTARQSLFSMTNTIIKRVTRAYADCWIYVPPVAFEPHPLPNQYDKKAKHIPWPSFLDEARGTSYAFSELDPDTVKLKDTREEVTPLHVIYQKPNRITKWISWGADPNAQDIRGQTPAYWAAYQGDLCKLILLHSHKANLTLADKRGKTPLRAAAKYNHVWNITYLVNSGCDINVRDGRGLTPLQVAAKNSSRKAYKRLIALNADTTLLDPLGRTASQIYSLSYRKLYADTIFPIRIFKKTPEEMDNLLTR